jgi:hypothetical protein
MHIKKLWAHAYYTTTFTQWARVGFAESLGLFAHGFYRLLRTMYATWARGRGRGHNGEGEEDGDTMGRGTGTGTQWGGGGGWRHNGEGEEDGDVMGRGRRTVK